MSAGDAAKAEHANVMTVGNKFLVLATSTQVVSIIGFLILTTGTTLHFPTQGVRTGLSDLQNIQLYNNYIGVTLMMLVGFGYLMTFLKHYGLGAVGLTFFITCLGMQVAILGHHIFKHLIGEGHWSKLPIDGMVLVEGDFAVAAFLISFGGLIGKVNPAQLVVLVVLESLFYNANTQLLMFKWLEVADAGGSIVIHMFGAYFGLAVAWVVGKPSKMEKEGASPVSDVFAMIGTVFLWLYWPSFVAAWIPAGSVEWDTALTNTVLALLGSCVSTFILSAALSGKILRPVDIQNATLAGGVSIGALANLNILPGGALLVGCAAGLLSTFGYAKVQPFLLEKLGLHDTCGIHNLHGMPSVFGGVLSIFAPLVVETGLAGSPGKVGNQILAIVVCLVVSILTGLFTGFVMKALKDDAEGFNDQEFWEVAEEAEAELGALPEKIDV